MMFISKTLLVSFVLFIVWDTEAEYYAGNLREVLWSENTSVEINNNYSL